MLGPESSLRCMAANGDACTCCCRYARAGARVAAALLGTEHMAEALAQILDAPPPPEASSAAAPDHLAVARYVSRPLALQVVRVVCQASAGVAAAANALGVYAWLRLSDSLNGLKISLRIERKLISRSG